ncbi:MAG: dTMP kinase [Deltaproteobacteria bacterium]|nr:dTMP kinase [Deltaproteobacteria bacterium]
MPFDSPTFTRGRFIAFEGLDGSGKSTQAQLLFQELGSIRGQKPLLLKEPTAGPYGRLIREMTKARRDPSKELKLFVLDRSQDVNENIRPALSNGQTVIIDRYILSNVAYQGALEDVTPEEIFKINEGFPWPNLTFLLEISVEEGLARVKQRGELQTTFENSLYLEKVKAIYDRLDYPGLIRLDGTRPPKQVLESVLEALKALPPNI